MIPENIIFITCQPWDMYFNWQVEVQIVNFRKFGISDKMQVVVWYPENVDLSKWYNLVKKYPEVKFFFYQDAGVNLDLYVSQLRPHSFKKHFAKYAEQLKDKVFFYHDSDIIFRELPDFQELIQGDVLWQSNTTGYLDYSYMKRKEEQGKIPDEEAVEKFAEIGGISVDKIKEYDGKTGGAQYILKGIDSEFWQDIENQCIAIRKAFFWGKQGKPNIGSINHKYFTTSENATLNENAGFQSWCADMWAINFALWKRGFKTDVTPKLDFSWSTDTYDKYLTKPIYHNAGDASKVPGAFSKTFWLKKNQSPIGKTLSVNPKSASKAYVYAIKAVK